MKDWTVKQVAAVQAPGRWRVSKNLYLQAEASPHGGVTKAWLCRYMRHGRPRWHGLGSVELVPLAEARDKALVCRRMLLDGLDPIATKRAARMQARLADASAMTFKQCSERHIAAHRGGWSRKHLVQWEASMAAYAYPRLGALPVAAIDTALIMRTLEPIWADKTETASRVRGRVEAVLDWATARQFRSGDNPARWRGHLDKLLPARAKVARVKHYAALPYVELPGFMATLREQQGIAARCLEIVILTAARTGEAVNARWSEFDLAARIWTLPRERMKAGRPHVVPLSDPVIEVLTALPRTGDFVFGGARPRRPIGTASMLHVLRLMGRRDLTTHGFRSTFRDWAAERTAYPRDVAEMALAHTISDATERAYRRGDLLAKRTRMMRDWSRFCTTPPAQGQVVEMRPARAVR